MAVFQAGAIPSSFGNVLFNPMAVDQAVQARQHNALLMDSERQQMTRLTEADSREHAAQAAGYILNLPDEQQPTAYKALLANARANGHAFPNAPPEYPGKQYMQMLQAQGIPAKEQYQMGMNQNALRAVDAALGNPATSGAAAPAAGGAAPVAAPRVAYGAGGPGASLAVPAEYMPYIEEASKRTGVPVDRLIAQMRQESGFNPGATGAAGEIGLMQIKPSTATDPGFGMTGVRDPAVLRDPRTNINFGADYLKARAGGGDMTDPAVWQRGLTAYNGGGDPNYVANVARYANPTSGGVAGRTPGAVTVAGPGVPIGGAPPGFGPDGQPLAAGTWDASPVVAAPGAPTQSTQAAPQAAPQPTPSGPSGSPGAPQQMELLPNGLSRQQDALVRAARMAANPDPQKILSDIASMQAANRKMNLDAWTAAHPNIRATPVPGVRNGQVGEVMWQGDHEVGFVPAPTRPAHAPYDIQKVDYERDAKELPAIADAGQQAQSAQIRLSQMRELAQNISTGAAGNTRAAWANIAETAGFPEIARALIASSANGDAAAAQEFAKLSLVAAGGQERSVLGARGGYQAIKLFKEANPNLDLRPEANRKILNMQLIGAQADADYASGALDFANHAGDAFRSDKGPYVPMSHFDQQWQAQRNPQIYAAAIAAINGDAWDKWTRGLKMDSPTDVKRVLDIVGRADPKAEVLWNNGQRHSVVP